MSNIEQVKTILAATTRDAEDILVEVRWLRDRLDEAVVRLRSVATGSAHAKADEAMRYLQQARERLEEACVLTTGAVDAAKTYRAVI